jgi:hypothetical protein
MSISWPTTLPPSPLLEGFSREKRNPMGVFNPQGGQSKVIAFYTAVPDVLTFSMFLTQPQRAILDNFFITTCLSGTKPFSFKDPDTGVVSQFRFIEGPPQYSSVGQYYTANITLEKLV